MNNLKPVTFVSATYPRFGQNTTQQIMLLKALKVTNDPEKLRQLIGARKVADVLRTLDKMALRKEFHGALAAAGIDFEYIVKGLKGEAETAEKSADRIKVYQTLLKSLGMDKYDDPVDGGAQWEESLIAKIEEDKKKKEIEAAENPALPSPISNTDEYAVVHPVVPESVKKRQQMEQEIGRSLYE